MENMKAKQAAKKAPRTTIGVSTLRELRKKARYYDLVLSSKTIYSSTAVAAEFGKSGTWLNSWLADRKIIKKVDDVWFITAKYAKDGLIDSRTMVMSDSQNEITTRIVNGWTEKGRAFIHSLFLDEIEQNDKASAGSDKEEKEDEI